MNLNSQPIEKLLRTNGNRLDVHSIFPTIQGEGPFCGMPCVFVRLAGCNLQCPWCDTEYTQGRRFMSIEDIVYQVSLLAPADARLVVVTGGEPFRQNLAPLFDLLIQNEFFAQVESNGTLPPTQYTYNLNLYDKSGVFIVCSPKAGRVNPYLADAACCFKYVLAHDSVNPDDGLPLQALGHTANPFVARPPALWDRPIYLQPMDAKDSAENKKNIEAVKRSAMRFNYTVQLQIHKYLGVE